KFHCIFIQKQGNFVLRNAFERTAYDFARIGIGRSAMRQVGLPHYMVKAESIPDIETFAGLFEPEIGIHPAADLFARTGLDALFPQLPLHPNPVARIEHIVKPAESGLGAYPVEPGVSFKHAGENHVRNKLSKRAMGGW